MTTRYFYFWCERCPTRITIDTDVPASSEYPDPEYTFATDGVALFQARPAKPCDDGLEVADLCPACGGQLLDLDGAREGQQCFGARGTSIQSTHVKRRALAAKTRHQKDAP